MSQRQPQWKIISSFFSISLQNEFKYKCIDIDENRLSSAREEICKTEQFPKRHSGKRRYVVREKNRLPTWYYVFSINTYNITELIIIPRKTSKMVSYKNLVICMLCAKLSNVPIVVKFIWASCKGRYTEIQLGDSKWSRQHHQFQKLIVFRALIKKLRFPKENSLLYISQNNLLRKIKNS